MKKYLLLMFTCLLLAGTSVRAESLPAATGSSEHSSSLAVIYANHAGKYEAAMNRVIHRELPKRLKSYEIADAKELDRRLQGAGMENPIWLEREDLIALSEDIEADYLVLFDLRPVIAQKKVTVLTKGNEAIGSLAVKILDLKTGRYVYVGELTAKESKMTVLFNTGKKTTSGKTVRSLMKDLAALIQKYIPANK